MNEDELRNAHDRFVKFAFSNIENSRNLLAKVLPSNVVATLDLTTLEFVPGTFVDTELRERLTDMLFHVLLRGGDEGYVYILFDHKSSPDSLMPFKMLRYMVRIWDHQLRNDKSLSPIIPLILYHGEKAWTTSRTLRDIVQAPKDLEGFVPDFDAALVDLSQYSDEDLRENATYTAVLQLLKYLSHHDLPERLPGILELFVRIMDEPDGMECLKTVLVYLTSATERLSRNQLTQALSHAFIAVKSNRTEGNSPMPTIAEQWKQEGREEGLERGLLAGINVVLELRFPAHAETLSALVSDLHSAKLLQSFLKRCQTAGNVDELQAFFHRNSVN